MKVLDKVGECSCCGKTCSYYQSVEDYSSLDKDLVSYRKFKDVYVYACPNCGFVSTDISGFDGAVFGNIKDSYEYKQIINYAYLNGLDKELYDCHSEKIPANLVEAFALVNLKSQEYEMFIRATNKAIELKQVMLREYKRSQDELGGEEDNDEDYETLYDLIKESLKCNYQQIDYYYHFCENCNFYTSLIYIENLVRLNKIKDAEELFNNITSNRTINSDLKDYFKKLFKK